MAEEGSQFQIGPRSAATRTSDITLERPVTLPLEQGGRQYRLESGISFSCLKHGGRIL